MKRISDVSPPLSEYPARSVDALKRQQQEEYAQWGGRVRIRDHFYEIYDPLTDEMKPAHIQINHGVLVSAGHSEPLLEPSPVISAEDRDLRLQCLELAISAAKSGSSFGESIPKIAQAYYLFSLGEVPPADPFAGLSFEQRLDALVQEFLRSEIEDPAKIKHSIEEVYNRLVDRFPPPMLNEDPSNIAGGGRGFYSETHTGEGTDFVMGADRTAVKDLTETIRMKHKDIRS